MNMEIMTNNSRAFRCVRQAPPDQWLTLKRREKSIPVCKCAFRFLLTLNPVRITSVSSDEKIIDWINPFFFLFYVNHPHSYPQAKEATHKIRGKSDILEMLCGSVDQELLPVKTFYFFFYAAFGSLFPLMGVYFKQMGMNPGQCGLLIGTRPFVEFLSAPFWGSYADR